MKICLIGEYCSELDEAMRKVSFYLAKELSKKNEVLTLNISDLLTFRFWKQLRSFSPNILHYTHGPSDWSYIILKILSFYCPGSKTVISAMHPRFSGISKKIIRLFKPNIVLTQSSKTKHFFSELDCKTIFFPVGIDLHEFKPILNDEKKSLRKKYNLSENKFILLHIGSIKSKRNIQLLKHFQNDDNLVLIVGAVSTGIEDVILRELLSSGCVVFSEYIEHIYEIYNLSDCYIFPTDPKNKLNSIEIPLSVLEAMACNLPVISTKFGALTQIFKECDGLFFVDTNDDSRIYEALNIIKSGLMVDTRSKVLQYSWNNIINKLVKIYTSLN